MNPTKCKDCGHDKSDHHFYKDLAAYCHLCPCQAFTSSGEDNTVYPDSLGAMAATGELAREHTLGKDCWCHPTVEPVAGVTEKDFGNPPVASESRLNGKMLYVTVEASMAAEVAKEYGVEIGEWALVTAYIRVEPHKIYFDEIKRIGEK